MKRKILTCLLLALLPMGVALAQSAGKRVNIALSEATGEAFFEAYRNATGKAVIYSADQAKRFHKITLLSKDEDSEELLRRVLHDTGLGYEVKDDGIHITTKRNAPGEVVVEGLVYDDLGYPLTGAPVMAKEYKVMQVTDAGGYYSFRIPRNTTVPVVVSFVGSQPYNYKVSSPGGKVIYDLTLKTSEVLEEVVVTGIYNRKLGNFTGASSSIDSKQLNTVGNQNILNSLSTIDPSIQVATNLLGGSDPNALPDLSMRGVSSIADQAGSLRSDFANNPNQPLFILDGFETSIQTIVDMDMNRIESVTVLKDASAKALYGSKAANGVIVVETKKLAGDRQRVTYNGDVSLELPDLTSYNLTNSLEKLEVEKLDGYYDSNTQSGLVMNLRKYNERKKKALEGLNTYWLAKPLRTGVGHKHSLSVELGDAKSLRANIDLTYNQIGGVMKGSDRNNLSTTANISYRRDNLLFRNALTILSNKGVDSPYGAFSDYSRMNPYWEAVDEQGNVKRFAAIDDDGEKIPNPMYNAMIGTHSSSKYYDFVDNLYAEWQATSSLRTTLRVGWNKKLSEDNQFYPADHSRFVNYSNDRSDEKGEYILTNGQSERISADLNANYNQAFGKHSLFLNGGAFVEQRSSSSYSHRAVGFSNSSIADITFAKQYAKGSTPSGGSSIQRELSFLLSGSYDYDNRYLFDSTFRRSASSLYGANNRWSNAWSLGLGWNVHNEHWMTFEPLQQLKLRASVGLTGNQNFLTNTAVATYRYYSGITYGGFTGAYITNMPNPDLKWEQKLDKNIGMDLKLWGLSLTLDLYQADTRNMLTDLTIPTSTGFSVVKDNLGLVRNTGVEARLMYGLWRGADGFVNIYGSVAHNKNYIVSLSESLREYNERMKNESTKGNGSGRPVQLYQDGQSMTAIWTVPSAGIDPMSGREVYIKKDGQLTYEYDPSDLAPMGDSAPLVRGNAGLNAEYKGVGLNVTLTYEAGGQAYNYTLVNKVENANIYYNVDKRLAEGRWRQPGQVTKYKKFESGTMTRPTSRFIQDRNDLNISSISLYYLFPKAITDPLKMERLRLALFMNNIATFSSIEVERGLDYPFARRVSCSISATF